MSLGTERARERHNEGSPTGGPSCCAGLWETIDDLKAQRAELEELLDAATARDWDRTARPVIVNRLPGRPRPRRWARVKLDINPNTGGMSARIEEGPPYTPGELAELAERYRLR